jgi:hypothetical protein
VGYPDMPYGRERPRLQQPSHEAQAALTGDPAPVRPYTQDDIAIERYRYLLRTAPPENIEQAHAEAFAKLTTLQRQQVLAQLTAEVPDYEQPRSDAPQDLARAATRAEMRASGTMERALGRRRDMSLGTGIGGMIVGNLLYSVAGAFIGTAVARTLFAQDQPVAGAGGDAAPADSSGDQAAAEPSDEYAVDDYGVSDHAVADYRATDYGGGYSGGDDYGGDSGGGYSEF